MGEQMETVNIKLPLSMRDALNRLAAESERTFAAEVRVALRRYLAECEAKDGARA